MFRSKISLYGVGRVSPIACWLSQFFHRLIHRVTFRLILLTFLMTSTAKAEELVSESQLALESSRHTKISVSYLSWLEFVDLDNGVLKDKAFANFYGNSIAFEQEFYRGLHGFAYEIGALFGQANAGGTQSTVSYQSSYRNWWGVLFSARYAYQLTPQISLSTGPLGLYRQMTWPNEGSNITVKSGTDWNTGWIGDLRLRLSPHWELKSSMGFLAVRASTFWSFGVGYEF